MEQHALPQRPANRLAREKSPYLLQHAHNPVDWHAWGEEAFAKARREDRPLFVSIGYSTCHWCHVMERESFEDPAIAALLNEQFVPVKVDREERPDVDEIYMAFVQSLTGQGGWPLNVWLTPERKPFYGGTYFPPADRHGRPGFAAVLGAIAAAYRERRSDIQNAAGEYAAALTQLATLPSARAALGAEILDAGYAQLVRLHDDRRGGFGRAPKFPRADFGALCLRTFHRTGDATALAIACRTLDAMAAGGIYDHLGGGFARYSTDGEWLVPHFEKMLYDNAQLAFHYLEAYQLTRQPRYARVARETLDYVLRDMTDPTGGFHSAQDADSEGEEGRFYLWDLAEVERLLPTDIAPLLIDHYGLTAQGNFEGRNILHRATTTEQLAGSRGLPVADVEARLQRGREILRAARSGRVRPHRDDKVLTAWNGLMIHALARGASVLEEARYLSAATRAADFVVGTLRTPSGLLRRYRDGEAAIPAASEEYACLVRGLLELYQAGFDLRYARAAIELHREMMERFADPADGALFTTPTGQADVIVRVKTGYDGATPTANSLAAANSITLFELTGEDAYAAQAERILSAFSAVLSEQPLSLATMLLALDAWLSERVQLVLAGDALDPRTGALVAAARSGFHPGLTISLAPAADVGDAAAALLSPVQGKHPQPGGAPAAYVCRGFVCRRPAHDPQAMAQDLGLTRATGGV